MRKLTRAEWADLVLRHPCPSLAYPWDGFGQALLSTSLGISDIEEYLTDLGDARAHEQLVAAYELSSPSHKWASEALEANERIRLEAQMCLEMGKPLSEFHSWPEADQDIAVAAWVSKQPRGCPSCGVSPEAMRNPDLVQVELDYCNGCSALSTGRETYKGHLEDDKGYSVRLREVEK